MGSRHIRILALVISLLTLCTVTTEAQGNWQPGDFGAFRFYLGLFEPNADSQYWDETFDAFSGSPSDFNDFIFGVDYLWRTSRSGGLLFGTSFYEGKATQAYLDWVDGDGRDISHLTTLSLGDLTAAYMVQFGRHTVRPYLGAGAGLLWWNLREEGSFMAKEPDLLTRKKTAPERFRSIPLYSFCPMPEKKSRPAAGGFNNH